MLRACKHIAAAKSPRRVGIAAATLVATAGAAVAAGSAAAEPPTNLPPDQIAITLPLPGCIPANTLLQDARETDYAWYNMPWRHRPPAGVWIYGLAGVNPWQPSAWLMGNTALFSSEGTACVPPNQLLPPQTNSTHPNTPGQTGQPSGTSTDTTPTTGNGNTTPTTGNGGGNTTPTTGNGGGNTTTPTTGNGGGNTTPTTGNGGGNGNTTTTTPTGTDPGNSNGEQPIEFTLFESQPYWENGVQVVTLSWTTPSLAAPLSYTVYLSVSVQTPQGGQTYSFTQTINGNSPNSEPIQVTGSSEQITGFTAYVVATNSAGDSATSNTVSYSPNAGAGF